VPEWRIVVIREVTVEDTDRVVGLLHQLWPEKRTDIAAMSGVVEKYVEDPRYWIFGYEDEGTLLGVITVSFRWTLFHGGEAAIIEDLIVDAGRRRKGIGAALVRLVENKIRRQRGVTAIEVESDLPRQEAHAFWESMGYSRLGFQFRKEMS
jgi:GNAT superfamily N-acetyltransferase